MTLHRFTLIAATISVSLFSLSALAGPEHMRGEREAPQPVTLSEARENLITQAASIDSNGDGRIDAAELRSHHEKQSAERKHRHFLARFDSNGDGTVSTDEFVTTHHDRLSAMDADGDGTVSVEELRQRHHGRHGARHSDSN